MNRINPDAAGSTSAIAYLVVAKATCISYLECFTDALANVCHYWQKM
jgi:hypothetical protein